MVDGPLQISNTKAPLLVCEQPLLLVPGSWAFAEAEGGKGWEAGTFPGQGGYGQTLSRQERQEKMARNG